MGSIRILNDTQKPAGGAILIELSPTDMATVDFDRFAAEINLAFSRCVLKKIDAGSPGELPAATPAPAAPTASPITPITRKTIVRVSTFNLTDPRMFVESIDADGMVATAWVVNGEVKRDKFAADNLKVSRIFVEQIENRKIYYEYMDADDALAGMRIIYQDPRLDAVGILPPPPQLSVIGTSPDGSQELLSDGTTFMFANTGDQLGVDPLGAF